MTEVLDIEKASFENPWLEEDFFRRFRQRNCICVVAENDDQIDGYMVYKLFKHRFEILNLAVHPAVRRQGIADELVSRLIRIHSDRTAIEVTIRETNLSGQLFFKSLGFKAVEILRDYFDDVDEDAYLMRYDMAMVIR
jgi:ribosomal-protein-alanine N-acetyltransferase